MTRRDRWTQNAMDAAVRRYLSQRSIRGLRKLFRAAPESVRQQFEADAARRLSLSPPPDDAAALWRMVMDACPGPQDRLAIHEPLIQRGSPVPQLMARLRPAKPDALIVAWKQLHDPAGKGLSDTHGWTDEQVRARLDLVKRSRLEWDNTTGSARKWWDAFENENAHRLKPVLTLAEELAWRGATVTEFFLAYVYSNTDNLRANLHYLDFTRCKKEQARRARASEAAQAAAPATPPTSDVATYQFGPAVSGGISDTSDWTERDVRSQLAEVESRIALDAADDTARSFWESFRKRYERQPHVLLRLAEELMARKCSVMDFAVRCANAGTDDPQANLYYYDYLTLKEEEERKKREAKARSAHGG